MEAMGTGKKQTAFLGLRVLGDQNLPTLFLLLDHPFAEVWAPGRAVYIRWTLEFRVQLRQVFPFHQKRMPNRHHRMINDMLVMMGGMYPSDRIHGVMNLE